jgi:hypothetical protein
MSLWPPRTGSSAHLPEQLTGLRASRVTSVALIMTLLKMYAILAPKIRLSYTKKVQ